MRAKVRALDGFAAKLDEGLGFPAVGAENRQREAEVAGLED